MKLFTVLNNEKTSLSTSIPMDKVDTLVDRLSKITNDVDQSNKKMRKQAWCNAHVMRRMHRY